MLALPSNHSPSIKWSPVHSLSPVVHARSPTSTYLLTGKMSHQKKCESHISLSSHTSSLSIYRWLYTLILTMDTNFQLRSKLRGVNMDPSLCPGWAYFVNNEPYSAFVRDYVDKAEASSPCPHGTITVLMVLYRSRHALAFRHYSTCLRKSPEACTQQVWPQLAVLATSFSTRKA